MCTALFQIFSISNGFQLFHYGKRLFCRGKQSIFQSEVSRDAEQQFLEYITARPLNIRDRFRLLKLSQPTGLYVAYNSAIITSSAVEIALERDRFDLKKYMDDFVCVLTHNCVAINPCHNKVHLIESILSKAQCDEIITKVSYRSTKV